MVICWVIRVMKKKGKEHGKVKGECQIQRGRYVAYNIKQNSQDKSHWESDM
jgi:hypothetical protein